MELRIATPEQLKTVYRIHLQEAFPPEELKPLAAMEKMWADGWYKPYCLFDGDEIVGEALLMTGHPGWAIIDYLCVAPERRNDGLGAEILRLLPLAEPDTVLFGEAEAPENAPDPVMARRRMGFYFRCGLRQAGYDTALFGVHFRTLYLADREVSDEELLAEHQYIYRGTFTPEGYAKFLRIPYDPSEPLELTEWVQ